MRWLRPVTLSSTDAPSLSLEESLVFAAVDGQLSVEAVAEETGLAPEVVEVAAEALSARGLLAVDAPVLPPVVAAPAPVVADEPAAEPSPPEEDDRSTHRALYRERFAALSTDERATAARAAGDADLLALCFDPEVRVVAALADNPAFALEHARLVALHHRTSAGLEILARRSDWLRDPLVERRLLRNPQCGEAVAARLLSPRTLHALWPLTVDREAPELTRTRARGHLRRRFATSTPEERVDLVLKTDGRCLLQLVGCSFDGRTTQLLCSRPVASTLLAQSLARFAATPTTLLSHLLRQPVVRSNPTLRALVAQHPNAP